ncbi:MAG: F5/8 type C domain protein [Planctomycetes bacterium ADurb.Bin412]|nr:MAG: F5/8 type C domain protein [Planctomycetes bacterium ADurb.Bin412]
MEQLLEIYYQSVGRNSVLLLNVPPDRRGLFYEVDVERLLGLRKALDTIFKTDLALKAAAKASNVWEDELLCGPANTVDGDPESFWATDDGVSEAWIEYDLGEPKKFNLAVLQENIVLGQRIEEFVVEWWDGKEWKEGSRGTTVGYKRILPMTAVEAQKVRVRILRSRVSATLSSFSLFYASIAGR